MNTKKIDRKETKMIAHRGVSGLETENSIAAFIAAGNRSYFGIETDVHVTKDGKYVIMHDENPERVSGVSLVVEESTFDEVRAIALNNIPYGGGKRADLMVPCLSEYIEICKHYDKVAVLELKCWMKEEDIKGIADEVASLGYLDSTIFISFCFENLVRLRKLREEAQIQFLTNEYSEELIQNLKEHKLDLDIIFPELTKERIDRLHQEGIKVNCWTCDYDVAANELASWGVDFITSNILE